MSTSNAVRECVGANDDLFWLPEAELRRQRTAKWTQFRPDVLPCWVADMDLAVAAPVREAIAKVSEAALHGYPLRDGRSPDRPLADAFVARVLRLYGWPIAPEQVIAISDLVQAIHACLFAFSAPDEGAILAMPSYPPFRRALDTVGRPLVPLQARIVDGRYAWNLDELAPEEVRTSRILLLCNPHNPTGRVLTRSELDDIAAFAIRHDLVVVSDEIHADLIHPGHAHVPIASLGPEIAARTVTLASASKSFNIAGLRCGVMHFGSAALQERFAKVLPLAILGQPGIVGIEATIAAWTRGDAWLREAVSQLTVRRDQLTAALQLRCPELSTIAPEATYLAWIDCSRLALERPAAAFFLEEASVAFSAGETFDPEAKQFVRCNFAASFETLNALIDRIDRALHEPGLRLPSSSVVPDARP